MMKRLIPIALFLAVLFSCKSVQSQAVGFSYFFPTKGYFSNPISPVSLSLPLSFGKYFQIAPGITLNSIGGMSLKDTPDNINSSTPLVGPFQSLSGSLVPTIVIPFKSFAINLKGGVFGFTSMNTKIFTGNMETIIKEAYGYDAVAATPKIGDKSNFGWGYVFGSELQFHVTGKIWGKLGADYFIGEQNLPVQGSYYYIQNSEYREANIDFNNSKLNYEGLQISVGVIMKN